MLRKTEVTTTFTIVFLILIKNVAQIGCYAAANLSKIENNNNVVTHRLTKRMDLESCLVQFDVHKNTIIRTGESQAIGGKYLQGIELETMEECQRLCCETESCDVYIFESKKDGYCYLFECGTPENFHCKFTRHANYTSAVLTPIVRHVNEITSTLPPPSHLAHSITSNISQQEWELSNLKLKPEVMDKTNAIVSSGGDAMNSLSGNNKKPLTVVAATLTQKENISVQCGRFQFACHSGECIAVYNACDGIPQCEDGSDEGAECSGANNNLNTNIKSTQEVVTLNKAMTVPTLSQYSAALSQQTPQQQLQNMQQHSQSPAILPHVVNNREDPNVWETRKIVSGTPTQIVGSGNHGNPESINLNQLTAQQQLQQQQQRQQQADSFTSYVNNRGQNNAAYDVGSSTLEQSGLYMPNTGHDITNNIYTAQQTQQQHILLPPPPPPPPAPLNSNWQQQAILNQQKQQQQQQQFVAQAIPQQQQQTLPEVSASYGAHNEAIQTQQQLLQHPQITNMMIQQQKQQPAQTLVQAQQHQPSQAQVVSLNEAANSEQKLEDSDEYEDSEEKSTEPPKKHKHKKVKSKSKSSQTSKDTFDDATSHSNNINSIKSVITPVHEQYEIIHQNMALEFRDHDGQSERPGGAVLSLTLGLLITAALAILIGCRMRTVGRRARRMGAKTPYSHEADFLVNGMYL